MNKDAEKSKQMEHCISGSLGREDQGAWRHFRAEIPRMSWRQALGCSGVPKNAWILTEEAVHQGLSIWQECDY